MIEDFKRWLAIQLVAINSVRHCTIRREDTRDPERDPSLVVDTWSGLYIHVVLLDDIPKPRYLKKMISEATRCGVGVLFVLDAALFPPDGERFVPDDGLVILHALYKDRIYTYRVQDDGPRVGQIHFKAFGHTESEAWYGPDVQIRNLPSYRVWVKAPALIKGNWLIAYFGTEAFWKNAETSAAREAFRKQYRHASTNTWNYVWDAGSTWREPGGERSDEAPAAAPPKPETKLDRSLALLGVATNASEADVKTAFRLLAREVHPDVSQLPKDEAENRFKVINEAYTYIKANRRW